MAAPLLAIMRGRQQMIDYFFPRVRRLVRDECFNFRGRWGHPDQVEISAPNEGWPIRLRLHFPALAFKLGKDEGIYRRADLVFVLHCWDGRMHRLTERPPFAILGGNFGGLPSSHGG